MFDSIKTWLVEKAIKQYGPRLIRHAVAALAALAATYGLQLPEETVGQLASQISVWLIPALIALLSFKENPLSPMPKKK